jgi:O-antigen ligase
MVMNYLALGFVIFFIITGFLVRYIQNQNLLTVLVQILYLVYMVFSLYIGIEMAECLSLSRK